MDREEFFRDLKIPFTQQQMDAITDPSDRILLLAVPGSGKTTSLIARLGFMIKVLGYDPRGILTITYTVAATRDMQSRYQKLFGGADGCRPDFRTINSFCAGVLTAYGQKIGKSLFRLAEEKTVAAMLTEIYRTVEQDYPAESDLQAIRTQIAYIKNSSPDQKELDQYDQESEYRILDIYRSYQDRLRDAGLMDFDDQLVYARKILMADPDLLESYRRRYRHLCVDEAQDTSRIQHEIIKLLVGEEGTLFMVGDEDQSIYGFRAAYPKALLDFEKTYPSGKVLLLEDNFRSTSRIVSAADRLIQKNRKRHEKHMRANRKGGEEIRFLTVKDRSAQYPLLMEKIREEAGQKAILFRDNECALPLVDLLEREGIPYRFRGQDATFFSHRIIRDIEAIIRFAYHQSDEELFLQIYYKLEFYLNKEEAMEACRLSSVMGIPITEAVTQVQGLSQQKRKNCRSMGTHLNRLTEEDASSAMKRIGFYMGYRDYLDRMGFSAGKVDILSALAEQVETPMDLLDRLEDLRDILRTGGSGEEADVILSTIHSSKGLEYDRVYLLDVLDGVLPSDPRGASASLRSPEREALEEERRLFYVAVTRAKDHLTVFQSGPSLFGRELLAAAGREIIDTKPAAHREGMKYFDAKPYSSFAYAKPVTDRRQAKAFAKEPDTIIPAFDDTEEKYRSFLSKLGEGVIVDHAKLGEGVVVSLEDGRIQIAFESGEKVFQTRFLFEKGIIRVKE